MGRSSAMIKVVTGNEAAAYGVLLVQPAVMTAYPITPASRISEQISEFAAAGLLKGKFVNVESEMSSLGIVTGASNGGVRVFTATASQGLAWMHEGLHWASGSRLPVVLVDANRPLGAPDNLVCGWIDTLSQRDTTWMQLYCESNQEVIDTVLQGYRIAEAMYLPLMICMDGVYLSYIAETVDIPDQALVDRYLPPYDPSGRARLGQQVLARHRPKGPPTGAAGGGMPMGMGSWTGNRYDLHKLALGCIGMAEKADAEFKEVFGRSYPIVEEYRCEDADTVLVTAGSAVGTARQVIDDLRTRGLRVGLVKMKMFRPFPVEKVRKALGNRKKVLVIERDISSGQCGIFFQELKWALYRAEPARTPQVFGFVGALGGEDITPQLIEKAIMYTISNEPPEQEAIWLGLKQEEKDDYDKRTVKVF
jgi:pyruvate/2-oxoacid:ferredoxin oxidoreductase alpha subunit